MKKYVVTIIFSNCWRVFREGCLNIWFVVYCADWLGS